MPIVTQTSKLFAGVLLVGSAVTAGPVSLEILAGFAGLATAAHLVHAGLEML